MKKIAHIAAGYPSDLTDRQWEIITGYFPNGNKSVIHKRSLVEVVGRGESLYHQGCLHIVIHGKAQAEVIKAVIYSYFPGQ